MRGDFDVCLEQPDGDLNGDTVVDIADVGIVGANWTAAQAADSAAALVPEPATVAVLGSAWACLGCRRRRVNARLS